MALSLLIASLRQHSGTVDNLLVLELTIFPDYNIYI